MFGNLIGVDLPSNTVWGTTNSLGVLKEDTGLNSFSQCIFPIPGLSVKGFYLPCMKNKEMSPNFLICQEPRL